MEARVGLKWSTREDIYRLQADLVNPCKRMLDVGCCTGWTLRVLAEAGKIESGIGVDVNPHFIREAERLHAGKDRLRFARMDARSLTFDDGSFDVVAVFQVLEHMLERDQEEVLREAVRVVRDDGCVVVTVPSPHFGMVESHITSFTADSFRELASRFGDASARPHPTRPQFLIAEIRKTFGDLSHLIGSAGQNRSALRLAAAIRAKRASGGGSRV